MAIWLYTLLSVIIVSLISLVGVFTFSLDQRKLEKVIIYLVSLSAGTLLGDAFIHLVPEAYKNKENSIYPAVYILLGILTFFILEKYIHWRHCHKIASPDHPHPFSYIILIGDAVHNFIDGLIIAGSFLVSVPVGIATTIAVIFHEIPHEIGNFGSLIYGGFSRSKALAYNFTTALTAIAGALVVLIINMDTVQIQNFLVPFAAGGFIYVASADLIPEIHKNTEPRKSFWQLSVFILGIVLMLLLLFIG
jgi:zinc and cadmium transporter